MDDQTVNLSLDDHALIVSAMLLAANSDLFPDWEFQTLLGVERDEVRRVAAHWPNVDMNSDEVDCAVLNSLNNLLGYPHGRREWVEAQLGTKLSVLDGLWRRAAASIRGHQGGGGYVDRMR